MSEYAVSRCKANDKLFGPVHGAGDSIDATYCGQKVNDSRYAWWILGGLRDDDLTCKRCIKLHAYAGITEVSNGEY